MISYVNEHLFDVDATGNGVWDRNGRENYTRYMIKTTSMMKRKNRETGKVEPFQKVLATHNMTAASHGAKTQITSTIGGAYNTLRVSVKTSTNTRYDSDVYAIAIPFMGYVVSVEDNENLDIFKGLLASSEEYFDHIDGSRYRKAIYAIVRPNFHAQDRRTGEYDSSCDFVATFALSNKNRENQDETNLKWTFKTVRVHFLGNGEYSISEETKEVPYDSFDPETTKNRTDLFPTVEPRVYENNN